MESHPGPGAPGQSRSREGKRRVQPAAAPAAKCFNNLTKSNLSPGEEVTISPVQQQIMPAPPPENSGSVCVSPQNPHNPGHNWLPWSHSHPIATQTNLFRHKANLVTLISPQRLPTALRINLAAHPWPARLAQRDPGPPCLSGPVSQYPSHLSSLSRPQPLSAPHTHQAASSLKALLFPHIWPFLKGQLLRVAFPTSILPLYRAVALLLRGAHVAHSCLVGANSKHGPRTSSICITTWSSLEIQIFQRPPCAHKSVHIQTLWEQGPGISVLTSSQAILMQAQV